MKRFLLYILAVLESIVMVMGVWWGALMFIQAAVQAPLLQLILSAGICLIVADLFGVAMWNEMRKYAQAKRH